MGAAVRFPLSRELLDRLPRHPDWRYERFDGEVWLSHRPRPLELRRPTTLPVPQSCANAKLRELDVDSDRAAVAALLLDAWSNEGPYRTLEAPAEHLSSEIERGLDAAQLGAVAVTEGCDGVCAAALVHAGHARTATARRCSAG